MRPVMIFLAGLGAAIVAIFLLGYGKVEGVEDDRPRATMSISSLTFLSEDEVSELREATSNKTVLSHWIPEGIGHGALAVSPEDGMLRGGNVVWSAFGVGGLSSAQEAESEAIKGCNLRRRGATDCVVVLRVAAK
jgi:hypothetical protein